MTMALLESSVFSLWDCLGRCGYLFFECDVPTGGEASGPRAFFVRTLSMADSASMLALFRFSSSNFRLGALNVSGNSSISEVKQFVSKWFFSAVSSGFLYHRECWLQ